NGALAELKVALRTLPNAARIFQLIGFIQNRQGRWEEARLSLERAAELDPRDVDTLRTVSWSYERFRLMAEAKSWLDRAVAAASPDDIWLTLELLGSKQSLNANTRPLHESLEYIRRTNPTALPQVAALWFGCAMEERDATAATEALSLWRNGELVFDAQI